MKANSRSRRNNVSVSNTTGRGNRRSTSRAYLPTQEVMTESPFSSNGSTRSSRGSKSNRRSRKSQQPFYPQQGFQQPQPGFYASQPGYYPQPLQAGFYPSQQQEFPTQPGFYPSSGSTSNLPTNGYISTPWTALSRLWNEGNSKTREILCQVFPSLFSGSTPTYGSYSPSGCFSTGNILQISPVGSNKTYTMMLVSIGTGNRITLISLKDGSHWNNSISVQDLFNITPSEMAHLVGSENYSTIIPVTGSVTLS